MTTSDKFENLTDFVLAVKKASDSDGKDVDKRLKIKHPFKETGMAVKELKFIYEFVLTAGKPAFEQVLTSIEMEAS